MSQNRSHSKAAQSPLFEGVNFDEVMNCIHCGLCLDSCPTYGELGAEQDSPRGRIYLMRALWEEQLAPEPEVLAPLERCLDCRACESVCPSNVAYGSLLEKTRAAVFKQQSSDSRWLKLQNRLFDRLFSGRGPLWVSRLGWLVRVLGIQKAMTVFGLTKLLPRSWSAAMRLMPHFEGSSFKRSYKPSKMANPKKTVALFTGCVMDVADHEIHTASIALLQAAGYEVDLPKTQGCCGALHAHKGFQQSAKQLAIANSHAFSMHSYAAILVNAAGCAAHMKHFHACFENSPGAQPVLDFPWPGLVMDLLSLLSESEILSGQHFKLVPEVTILYDAPCHQIHAQKSDQIQREFLEQIPGVTFKALKDAERCCGAGGIYNVAQPSLSQAVLNRKLDDIEATLKENQNAGVLLSANPGCLYQLRSGIQLRNLPLLVQHPAVFLAERLKK